MSEWLDLGPFTLIRSITVKYHLASAQFGFYIILHQPSMVSISSCISPVWFLYHLTVQYGFYIISQPSMVSISSHISPVWFLYHLLSAQYSFFSLQLVFDPFPHKMVSTQSSDSVLFFIQSSQIVR